MRCLLRRHFYGIDSDSLGKTGGIVVPDLGDAATKPAVNVLKTRLEGAKPLGLVRVSPEELLVIYDCMLAVFSSSCRSYLRM